MLASAGSHSSNDDAHSRRPAGAKLQVSFRPLPILAPLPRDPDIALTPSLSPRV
jgi:hypothetical protein